MYNWLLALGEKQDSLSSASSPPRSHLVLSPTVQKEPLVWIMTVQSPSGADKIYTSIQIYTERILYRLGDLETFHWLQQTLVCVPCVLWVTTGRIYYVCICNEGQWWRVLVGEWTNNFTILNGGRGTYSGSPGSTVTTLSVHSCPVGNAH